MSFSQKIIKEVKSLLSVSLFFGVWIGVFMLLKTLMLDEYKIQFNGMSKVLIGTLILAKVVLILEHVPIGQWMKRHPAWILIIVRTILYTGGVFVVILLEKAFEARHDHAGFIQAIQAVLAQASEYHVLANTICLTGAFLVYNAVSLVHSHLGPGKLTQIFMSPVKAGTDDDVTESN